MCTIYYYYHIELISCEPQSIWACALTTRPTSPYTVHILCRYKWMTNVGVFRVTTLNRVTGGGGVCACVGGGAKIYKNKRD